METLHQAVTEVSQLLMNQRLKISSLSEQKQKTRGNGGKVGRRRIATVQR